MWRHPLADYNMGEPLFQDPRKSCCHPSLIKTIWLPEFFSAVWSSEYLQGPLIALLTAFQAFARPLQVFPHSSWEPVPKGVNTTLLDVVSIMTPFSGTDFPCQASVHCCGKYPTEITYREERFMMVLGFRYFSPSWWRGRVRQSRSHQGKNSSAVWASSLWDKTTSIQNSTSSILSGNFRDVSSFSSRCFWIYSSWQD